MVEQVERTIKKWNMLTPNDRVVVGVSGGADSVCLLRVLCELREKWGLSIEAVHVHHGIRGQEAEEDREFVEDLCRELHVPLTTVQAKVPQLAKEWKMTEEEAGRRVRYDAFYREARKQPGTKIAVAHNQNDVAETILFRLARGTGLKGLGSIPPVREGIIRPLIETDRAQIETYLQECGQDFCTDSTNEETDYARNRIRHQALPALETINPGAVEHMARTAEWLREIQEMLEVQQDELERKYVAEHREEYEVSDILFDNEPEMLVKLLLKRLLAKAAGSEKDIEAVHLEQLMELRKRGTGKACDLPYGMTGEKSYGCIRIRRKKEVLETHPVCMELPVPGKLSLDDGTVIATRLLAPAESMKIPRNQCTKWFDYDIIMSASESENGLKVRTRQAGDYLVIDKNRGTKKLKDYLIDMKIPRERRNQLLLLASGHHVHWVLGMRTSEDSKVTDATEKILEIQIDGGKENE